MKKEQETKMSEGSGDFLSVLWMDYNTKRRFAIGKLSRNVGYKFEYVSENIEEATKYGFEPLVAFPDVTKAYENEAMFPAFTSRLPDKRRKDIKEILRKYNLDIYNEFELLKKSGGKLPIDTIEFVDPTVFNDKIIDEAI